jgi:hypothetical protein
LVNGVQKRLEMSLVTLPSSLHESRERRLGYFPRFFQLRAIMGTLPQRQERESQVALDLSPL